jgi:(p)ppGpp synthase/HD superfamily hydrolase
MTFSERYGRAVDYAVRAHTGQTRKGTPHPYVAHPIAVSALVIEHGGSQDQAIAALLHDVLEDCGEHHAVAIEDQFGSGVLEIVRAMTDGVPDEHGEKPPWKARKEAYIQHLADAPQSVALVAAADKAHNAGAISADHAEMGDAVFEKFKASKQETVWYYRALADVLAARLGPDHRLVTRLGREIAIFA